MTIEENIDLSPLVTLRVGGKARFLIRTRSEEDLKNALIFAQEKNIPFFILGGGSNTLVPDQGFFGLVIKIENKGIDIFEEDTHTQVVAGAGEVWDDFVLNVVLRDLSGIENLSYIPGTVGGAIAQNIGAYGVEARDCVAWVEVLDKETMSLKRFSKEECCFGYRDSVFKKNHALVVVRVAFNLARTKFPRLEYEEVKKYFVEKGKSSPSLMDIREAIIAIRVAKLPAPTLGTAGSFFKNPIIADEIFLSLEKKFPGIKAHPVSGGNTKLSAAWLLDTIGRFKGVRRGDAGVYDKHALILVNYGNATAKNILDLAREMKECIKEKTEILLEEEVFVMKNIL